VSYLVTVIQKAYYAGATEPTIYFAIRLVRETVWPLVLAMMIFFMVYRIGSFVYRTIFSVMAGFQFTISMPRWVYAIAGWKARR
jgi:hypothetical protein